jgi:hypothetical protein
MNLAILSKLVTLIPLPAIPVPSWFVQILAKKLALEAKTYIEDPHHLIALKQHVRDWLISHLADHQVSKEYLADAVEVIDALLGIAPATNVKVVSNGTDVQAVPAKPIDAATDPVVAQATAETLAVTSAEVTVTAAATKS